MNALVVLRLLDTFFRHRWLYLVPVVLLGAVGAWAVTSAEDSYQSVGTMKVERAALVSQLTGTERDPGFGWDTPAGATAESLNSLLRTETFVDEIATTARLEGALDAGLMTLDDVRRSVSVYPDGVRLIKVVGTNEDPEVAHRIAEAAISAYVATVKENELSDSVVALEFLQQKLPDYEADVAEAENALGQWLDDHPEPAGDESRPTSEEVELGRLQDDVSLQDQRLAEAAANVEQAQLSVEQKEAEVLQRFEVIDPPQLPAAPQPRLKQAVLTVAMALIVGCLLALAAIVIATALDRTIRFPADVQQRLGTRALAVVPRARMSAALRRRLAELAVNSSPAGVRAQTEKSVVDLSSSTPAASVTSGHFDGGESAPGKVGAAERNGTRSAVTLKRVR